MSEIKIKIRTGPHAVRYSPVSVVAPADIQACCGALTETVTGASVPCQIERVESGVRLTWIVEAAPAMSDIEYILDPVEECLPDNVEVAEIGDNKLEVTIGGQMFTRYNYGPEWARPFLFPVIGPTGKGITRNWPMVEGVPGETTDHVHHKGIYVAYGEVNDTDNWAEGKDHAWIRHRAFEDLTSGCVYGRFRSLNDWTDHDGAKQVEDLREFTFYATPAGERLVDVSIVFRATVGDVRFTDTKEGGIISVRVATSMDGDKGGTIVNAFGGVTEAETWGKPAPWVDYYGPLDGQTVGIAIMDHPESFRYPTRWHVRDYGLFTANPFALKYYEPDRGWNGDHLLKQGEEMRFRYRLYIHSGRTEEANVRDKWLAFACPPKVTIEA